MLQPRPGPGLAKVLLQQVDRQLVGGHHDGGVGDLSDELRGEALVEAPAALLAVDEAKGLPEGAVLQAGLPHPSPRHLWGSRRQ